MASTANRTTAIALAVFLPAVAPALGAGEVEVPAQEGRRTDEMLKACKALLRSYDSQSETAPLYSMGLCQGWIDGVRVLAEMDLLFREEISETQARYLGCIESDNVTNEQISRIFVRYAEAHPEQHHQLNAIVLMRAMREAFPCDESAEGAGS